MGPHRGPHPQKHPILPYFTTLCIPKTLENPRKHPILPYVMGKITLTIPQYSHIFNKPLKHLKIDGLARFNTPPKLIKTRKNLENDSYQKKDKTA